MSIYLNVISIKKKIFSDYVQKIHIFGYEGILNIYPGHSPLLTLIKPSILYIFMISKKKKIYVSNGILEIQPKIIQVLPDEACFFDDLNYDELIRQKNDINKKILKTHDAMKISTLKCKLLDITQKIKLFHDDVF